MSTADDLRRTLGPVSAWTFSFDGSSPAAIADAVRAIEDAGYPALWIPEGGGSGDILTNLGWLLGASDRLIGASGIANVMAREADVLARGAAFLEAAYPGRLVLGIGIGHQATASRRGVDWSRPLERMAGYLRAMDDAVEQASLPPRMLAALGDGTLRLAGSATAGAHTYFVPPEHTAHARSVLGPEPFLAVEQGVILGADREAALAIARPWCADYLELPNYARNWTRLGFGEEIGPPPGDRLVDAAIAIGDVGVAAERVRAHLDAGADQVCVQVLGADESDPQLEALRELAAVLLRG